MIDTLQIADELAEGGIFTRDQAERLARVSVMTAGEALVTKADLSATESALKADLSATESALKADLNALRSDMVLLESRIETTIERGQKRLVMWFAGIMVMHATAVIGLTVGLVKLL